MLLVLCWWNLHQCPHAAGILLESSQTQVFTPHSASPEKATDIYTIMILLVLLNGTGYGSRANVAELYVFHPSTLPGVTQAPPHCGTIFRRSPGSAAVTTLGQILQCSVWTRHQARSQETCLVLKQIQPCNVQPTVITEADLVQLCSVPVCAGYRRNACPRDSSQMLSSLASICKLEVLMWPSRLRVKWWVACKRSLHLSKSLFILSHTRKERG